MQEQIHTVLGANGAIGKAIITELETRQLFIRKVSRNPSNQSSWVQADLLSKEDTENAIRGSNYVYLCIGLPYNTKIWESQWLSIMKNVINACAKAKSKLIFLDNIYMYTSKLPIPFDENTEQNPKSKKGKIRKNITDLMLKAMEKGKIDGLIGRSADFYGANAINSPFYISFLEKMLQGKNPLTLSPINVRHTYANCFDNGRALVELALSNDCYGQVWHLPVQKPITMQEILLHFNKKLKSNYKISVMPKIVRNILSVFVPILKEVNEMQYQFEQDYVMNFSKFKNRFPTFKVTSYQKGIDKMVESFNVGENTSS